MGIFGRETGPYVLPATQEALTLALAIVRALEAKESPDRDKTLEELAIRAWGMRIPVTETKDELMKPLQPLQN